MTREKRVRAIYDTLRASGRDGGCREQRRRPAWPPEAEFLGRVETEFFANESMAALLRTRKSARKPWRQCFAGLK